MSDNNMQVWQQEIANVADLKAKLAELSQQHETVLLQLGEANRLHRHWESEADRRLTHHQADIDLIGERLLDEAEKRRWCNEYDEVVASMNRRLHIELPTRERDFSVDVPLYITVNVTARNDNHAIELAEDIVRQIEHYADNQINTSSSVGEFEVEESD